MSAQLPEAVRKTASDEVPFVFQQETAMAARPTAEKPWKVMIVDDDNEVHTVSRLVLRDFSFEGRSIEFLSAHSGAAAKRLLAENPDTAVLLLDVVMETDDAGLDVVRYVRNTLNNYFVRIVLRTGQPGQAPEKTVVVDYDINDYKEKTELTAQKLVTTVVSALRAYRDIQIIDASRKGLEQIIGASRNLFELQSLAQFSAGVLRQLTSLLHLGEDSLYVQSSGFAARRDPDSRASDYRILAGTGQYDEYVDRQMDGTVPAELLDKLLAVAAAGRTVINEDEFIGYFRTSNGSENIVYLRIRQQIGEMDAKLLEVFATNVAIAFDNIYLNQELVDTQVEVIHTLSEVVESRCTETGHHVVRVGETARLLAELIGLSESDQDLIRLAAPMHDLGKIAIPDALLHKPGRLTPAEYEIIKSHTTVGWGILKGSKRARLRAAAITALQHHEWWNGAGYPAGLKGEDIHIFGRLVAVADVFDALAHSRRYKQRWPLDRIADHFRQERGTHFEPRLVDVFLANRDALAAIIERYPDPSYVQADADQEIVHF